MESKYRLNSRLGRQKCGNRRSKWHEKKAPPIQKSQAELNYAQFGTILKKLIKAKGYTQENFAKAVGISYSSLMSILKGDRQVYVHIYAKMIDVLGVSDLIIINNFAEDPELIKRANLYMELLKACEDLPLPVLEKLNSLVRALIQQRATNAQKNIDS